MEKEINIAEILKDKPKGTKLYSSACGKCELKEADDKSFKISFYSSKSGFMNGGEGTFDKNGNLYDDGECIIFPSKEMRDWSKFAWKRGDILVDTGFDNINCIFDAYISEDYTKFRARYCYRLSSCSNDIWFSNPTQIFSTKEFMRDPCPSLFIKKIEEHYKGKLNLETLEIEKPKQEFKDGDILYMNGCRLIYIFKKKAHKSAATLYYASLDTDYNSLYYNNAMEDVHGSRLATDSEKQQLFDALAKKGKAWDAEKKMIVDLKPLWTPKAFDKVLVKDETYGSWKPALFWMRVDAQDLHPYMIIGGKRYRYCEPYEGNEHLLGTTNSLE